MKAIEFIYEKYEEVKKQPKDLNCVSVLVLIPHNRNMKRTHTFVSQSRGDSKFKEIFLLVPDSQDLRLTFHTNNFRRETSGKFMFPSIEKTLRYNNVLMSFQKLETLLVQEMLNFIPKVLSSLIYDYFNEDLDSKPNMPFAMEILEPPYKDLPDWLSQCWSSVRWILVEKSKHKEETKAALNSAYRLKQSLCSKFPITIVSCSL